MTSLLLVELFSLKLLPMASSCAFGLKNLLSPQANSNSIPITKPIMKPFQKLEEVSLGSNASLSTLISSPSSPTKFRALLSLSLHSSFPTSKLLSMASYGGELLLDSFSPWSCVSSQLFFFSIPLPLKFIFQEAKESIDEEDLRPTSSTWSYIRKWDLSKRSKSKSDVDKP